MSPSTPTRLSSRQASMRPWEQALWLRSARWDGCVLLGSSALAVFPLLLYALVGDSAIIVNLVIAAVIGGPHMYATFLRTFLAQGFWQAHRWLLLGSLGLPILVVLCAQWHFALLLTLFFCWAALHVLHQILYLLACYERLQPAKPSSWGRGIDYAVVLTCLYPCAIYHCIYGEFTIGNVPLLYPAALKTASVFYAVAGVFLVALGLFIGKTVLEVARGEVQYPRLLLIGITVSVALFITSYSGLRLEIAFQGFNTWHSLQYLALNWHFHSRRQQREESSQYVWHWVSTLRLHRLRTLYSLTAACTVGSLLLIGSLARFTGFTFQHSYYVVVLSCLLMHYCHDHVLFTQVEALVPLSDGHPRHA